MRDLDQWELFCRMMLLQAPVQDEEGDDALCSCAALLNDASLLPAA